LPGTALTDVSSKARTEVEPEVLVGSRPRGRCALNTPERPAFQGPRR
jgi:hypothetical protein